MPKSKKERGPSVRYWEFTLNNPTGMIDWDEDDENHILRYAVYQPEVGKKEATHHYQGFVACKRDNYRSALNKILPRASWYPVRLDRVEERRAYAMKDDETRVGSPEEWGVWTSVEPGRRSDLPKVAKSIKENGLSKTIEDFPDRFILYNRGMIALNDFYESKKLPPPDEEWEGLRPWEEAVLDLLNGPVRKRRIIWIWSKKSGTGKSAFQEYVSREKSVYLGSDEHHKTMNSYDGEEVIWFDWARAQPHDAKFLAQIERLSNRTKQPIGMYGRANKLVVAHIVVTSNRPPPHIHIPERIVEFHIGPPEELINEDAWDLARLDINEDTDMYIRSTD